MKLGRARYLQKPFEIDELLVVVRRALDHQRLQTDTPISEARRDEQFDHTASSDEARDGRHHRRAERFADTKSTVLITGETGTARSCRRAIHNRSAQRNTAAHQGQMRRHPGVAARVGALRHVRGAFHRRHATKKGKFALADAARSFSTKSGRWRRRCSRSCCASCRSAKFEPLGAERTERFDGGSLRDQSRYPPDGADGKFQEDLF